MKRTILFHPEHVQPIIEGIKIKTRRTGKRRWKVGGIHKAKTEMLTPEYFALLRVLTLHQEPLGAMTEKDAWDEGGYTLEGYKEEWEKINGKGSWNPKKVVWVIQFERVFNFPEICKFCHQKSGILSCHSKHCCVTLLFDNIEKYSNSNEITDFCCVQRCHHEEIYHDKVCPIKLAGAGNKYYPKPERYEEKDKAGYIIKRLYEYDIC